MLRHAFKDLDTRKWIDRLQPQTLAIATWLLYIEGAFALVDYIDRSDINSAWTRTEFGGIVALISALSYVAGPFLMANGKRLGWWISVYAAASPWVLRVLLRVQYHSISLRWVITQSDTIGFVFEVALVALLLHPLSRRHERTWLR